MRIRLPSPPSADVALPPYARRLDVRAARAAFAAGTLSTVGDDTAREDVQRDVEVRHADGYDPDNVKHDAEMVRQARLRRWQAIR